MQWINLHRPNLVKETDLIKPVVAWLSSYMGIAGLIVKNSYFELGSCRSDRPFDRVDDSFSGFVL